MAGWLQAALIVAVVVALHVPVGDYMARAFTSPTHWRAEKLLYRAFGVDPDREQGWKHYGASLLAFSSISILILYGLFRLQGILPLSLGHPGLPAPLAFQTAVSFTTNTSWQNYAGESTMGHLAVMAGLGVQAFGSAAVGRLLFAHDAYATEAVAALIVIALVGGVTLWHVRERGR